MNGLVLSPTVNMATRPPDQEADGVRSVAPGPAVSALTTGLVAGRGASRRSRTKPAATVAAPIPSTNVLAVAIEKACVDRVDDGRHERLRPGLRPPPGSTPGSPHRGRRHRSGHRGSRRHRPAHRRPRAGRPPAAELAGSSSVSVVAKIVPVMARPTVPPTCWKNVRLLVAVPSRSTGTLFWTMSVNTANVGPTPSPVTNIQRPQHRHRRVGLKVAQHEQPDRHDDQGAEDQQPVAAGPADDLAGGDGADDQPAEQRQHLIARLGRRRSGHDLEPARQEDDGREEPERGQEDRPDRDRERPVAEQVERHDRLGARDSTKMNEEQDQRAEADQPTDRRVGPVGRPACWSARRGSARARR